MVKKTINRSKVDDMIQFLTMHDVNFFVFPMTQVKDSYSNRLIPIRRLEFESKVMLEQMVRAYEPNDNDVVISCTFATGTEPLEWLPEISLENVMDVEIF